MSTTTMNEAAIRETAYLMWLDEGQPEGRDHEHWLRAIETLKTPEPKARKAAKKPAKAEVEAGAKSAAPKKARAKSKAKATV